MNFKIGLFFILTILIPTALLAYFGLLAARNEKVIVEKSMRQKYEAMANIVEDQVRQSISRAPEAKLGERAYWDSVLAAGADVFRDEVFLFSREGAPVGKAAPHALEQAAYVRPMKDLPYLLGVFEKHPFLVENLETKQKNLTFYISIIIFSAFSILGGGIFTTSALTREWRQAKLKSEFASHLSHDLRRPLTSIRMFSEMLKNDLVPTEKKKNEYYGIISEESEKLTHLANNILDFSRIEEGRRKYNIKDEDITRVARETVERFKVYTIHQTRDVILEIEPAGLKGTAPPKGQASCAGYPMVRVDAGAVSQALMNLLTNADKYSPADREIRVSVRRGKRQAVIEVADRGEGIPPDEQKRVFQKFYRSPRKNMSEVEGSGLGLALVKHTAEAHGGRVAVESELGKGSKFTIYLPV